VTAITDWANVRGFGEPQRGLALQTHERRNGANATMKRRTTMLNRTMIATLAAAVIGAAILSPVSAFARIAGPSVTVRTMPNVGVNVQAKPPMINSKFKIKFNCYYTRQRNELGIWVNVRICG
jgi:hypothetical protein